MFCCVRSLLADISFLFSFNFFHSSLSLLLPCVHSIRCHFLLFIHSHSHSLTESTCTTFVQHLMNGKLFTYRINFIAIFAMILVRVQTFRVASEFQSAIGLLRLVEKSANADWTNKPKKSGRWERREKIWVRREMNAGMSRKSERTDGRMHRKKWRCIALQRKWRMWTRVESVNRINRNVGACNIVIEATVAVQFTQWWRTNEGVRTSEKQENIIKKNAAKNDAWFILLLLFHFYSSFSSSLLAHSSQKKHHSLSLQASFISSDSSIAHFISFFIRSFIFLALLNFTFVGFEQLPLLLCI